MIVSFQTEMILSADIGGTKTALALSRIDNPVNYIDNKIYKNDEYSSLLDILEEFVHGRVLEIMVLGIAGPIKSRKVDLTNIDWTIDADMLEDQFACDVYLLNDLEAAAYGVPHLSESEINLIYSGDTSNSLVEVIVAAGTGLGKASIYYGDNKIVHSSEGGHIGFSPKTDFQRDFFDYLQNQSTHVSFEMVCSSVGFKNLQSFILEKYPTMFSDEFKAQFQSTKNLSRLIFKETMSDSNDSKPCKKILDEVSHMIGSYLGDMVLTHLPRKIFLTGGIGRNILNPSKIIQGYLDKANMSHVVQNVPLVIIKDPDCGLHGSSWFAQEKISLL